MKKIEIFKVGLWTSAEGRTIGFTEADLQKTASAYDPKKFDAPLVLGHPKTADPAYGWVKSLSYSDGKLIAEVDDVEPEFAEAVSQKRYKKISASFYTPDHPGNPVPGTYYLRHVGFLGAAAPAVKGLKPVSFAEADALTFDFSEDNADEAKTTGFFSKIKAFIAEKFGDEDAEKVIPAQDLAALEGRSDKEPEKTSENSKANGGDQEEAFAEREAELNKRENELAKLERDFRHSENERFLDGLVSGGRITPSMKPKLLSFMDGLADGSLSFSEKESGFKEILNALPKIVEFEEKSKPEATSEQTASFSVPDGFTVNAERLELHKKISAYQDAHQGVSYTEAAKIIGG